MNNFMDKLYEIACYTIIWSFPVIGLLLGLIVTRIILRGDYT